MTNVEVETETKSNSASTSSQNGDAELLHRAAQADSFESQLRQARAELDSLDASLTFRLARKTSSVLRRVLPTGSRRRQVLGRTLRAAVRKRHQITAIWFPPTEREERLAPAHLGVRGRPNKSSNENSACSFLVISLSGANGSVTNTTRSLHKQIYREYKLVEAANAEAANAAIQASDQDFVLFLKPGDQLTPHCLDQLRREIRRDPALQLIYWDDALVNARRNRRFRPGWSPETLLSANYLSNAFAVRPESVRQAGGLRSATGDAMLWDLLLRLQLEPEEVLRIPKILSYHVTREERVTESGRKVVARAVQNRGWNAEVKLIDGTARLVWKGPQPRVSVIIPTRHNRNLLEELFEGLRATKYDDFEIIVVDNGSRNDENEAWYSGQNLPLQVFWWDQPFNYAAVNNLAARSATGELLVFLNDDIEVIDPGWLQEIVGWATVPGIGACGMQLLEKSGKIQHGGVILGIDGFAGHLFAGLRPGDETLLGSTSWYRNTLAVTGACLAIMRENFEQVGGFDERFVLCGNDVALGLSLVTHGFRNICSPMNGLHHLESVTRGNESSAIPMGDFYASWWKYQPWMRGGDPYYSPRLSLVPPGPPRQRPRTEPFALEMAARVVGRNVTAFDQEDQLRSANHFAKRFRASAADVEKVHELHRHNAKPLSVNTINWFIPGIDSPFYGGINTAFRIADYLHRNHGVVNRFVVSDDGAPEYFHKGITAAYPGLESSEVFMANSELLVKSAPDADVAIATLWTTAYDVARYANVQRKFYLVQDFEPRFYPAGTMYAIAEESYRLGLYGLCNTENLAQIYRNDYHRSAFAFSPAVDTSVFNAAARHHPSGDKPVTLFVYARPGHWRNCWEIAYPALVEAKAKLGNRLRIVGAGSWALPESEGENPCIKQLGLLDYRLTGDLYRHCDIGLALTVSEHPSYLPLELMACGAAVIAFDNPAGYWLMKQSENALLTPQTIDGLVDAIELLVNNAEMRQKLAVAGQARIATNHSNWDGALSGIYQYLCDPEHAKPA